MRGLPDLGPELGALLHGVAGTSPYLGRSIEREAEWLAEALDQAPEATMATLCDGARLAERPEIGTTLRRLKRRAALIIALADLGGLWPFETVTGALTDFAEASAAAALVAALRPSVEKGRLPGLTTDDLDQGAGLFVLAMGKMGARELNYSSDIDLICLFDAKRFERDALFRAREGYIRAVRRFTQTLSQQTEEGYVFRTDLRLRPDAGSTPVAMSLQAAELYYEAEGRTWERGAFIKARASLGDLDRGRGFLRALQPFIWRKHLDFATLHDVQDIRSRIRQHKALDRGAEAVAGHDVKLGRGGIRDIEFFTQTRQLIAGGRDPGLRAPGTVPALAALAQRDWISQDTADRLSARYVELREVEHRLQMIADAQTHRLPKTREGFEQLACLMGHSDAARLERDLAELFADVDALAAPFLSPGAPLNPSAALAPPSDEVQRLVDRWPSYPALRSERGRQIFERLKPSLLAQFARAARPEEALASFDSFLNQLPAGVQLFSLFEANPALVDLLVDICAVSPALARYLSRHAGVLDAVLMGEFFAPWPGLEALTEGLNAALEGLDYEAAMDTARRWQKEWHFRIGVHVLRGLITPAEAAGQYSDLAQAVLSGLWPVAQAETARRHGWIPGGAGAVLAMGSLGARQMNAASDLDLIVIFEAQGGAVSDGARPLEARGWYAKATK
ncbi:MAG: glutamine-synthetase adenylyltransferase, partial [Pseudomonadota bacterium]